MTRRRSAKNDVVTIDDVARKAGVSTMTVSRVINNNVNVRDSKRQAVIEAIADLKYAPNPAAQNLAGARQVRLCLLHSNPSASYLSALLLGGLNSISGTNVQLSIERIESDDSTPAVVERLVRAGVDGLIVPPPFCESAKLLDALNREKIETVRIATALDFLASPSLSIDDFAAAYAMTKHLIVCLGHRRIGFIEGDRDQSASRQRLEGYKSALRHHRIKFESQLVAEGHFTYQSGLEAAKQLLGVEKRPTAIFASNDDMAAAAMAIAHRFGLDVPADITVCGFDDTAIATTIWPELTTIRQPIELMAQEAVRILIDNIRLKQTAGSKITGHQSLDFALIRRQSEGRAPS